MGMVSPAGRRLRLLRAMGVVPYRLHVQGSVHDPELKAAQPGPAACVLVLPQDCAKRPLAVLEKALDLLRADVAARIERVVVVDGRTDGDVPAAPVYVAFGPVQAAAVGQCLGAKGATDASVIPLDAPDALLGAAGKRQLWHLLRRLPDRSQDGGASV